jgi:hypothetical protein
MSTNFNLDVLKSLAKTDAELLLNVCCLPLDTGAYAININGKFERIECKLLQEIYFQRLPKVLRTYQFETRTDIRKVVCELNKPEVYSEVGGQKCFNICARMKARYQPMAEFDQSVIESLNFFLRYIKEVLANNSVESYEYLLKWFSNVVKGKKNDACLYLKGIQGIGKSTISDFLKDYVLGWGLFIQSDSEPLTSAFNGPLGGKLLVQFTEFEAFNKNNWSKVSSKLKSYITSNTYLLHDKYLRAVQIANINNYVIDSNFDAIKDDSGRRYFILDVNPKYLGNEEYWATMHDKCDNDETGNAFYSFLMDIDTTGFRPQRYPITESKKDSFAAQLGPLQTFLKKYFLLRNKNIKQKPGDLRQMFNNCMMQYVPEKLQWTVFKLNKELRQLGIDLKGKEGVRINGNDFYNISVQRLNELATIHHWRHELDGEEFGIEVESPDEEPQISLEDTILSKNMEIAHLHVDLEKLKHENGLLKLNVQIIPKDTAELPRKKARHPTPLAITDTTQLQAPSRDGIQLHIEELPPSEIVIHDPTTPPTQPAPIIPPKKVIHVIKRNGNVKRIVSKPTVPTKEV